MGSKPTNEGSTRRKFLRNAAVTAAAVVATPAVARSAVFSIQPSRSIGANDRINIAHVGVGVQGSTHVRLLKEKAAENNTKQVAVCDLYRRRLRQWGTEMGVTESAWYDDHRKMLENKDIDAVVIATA